MSELDFDEQDLEFVKQVLKNNNGRAPWGKILDAIAKYQSARLADTPEQPLVFTGKQVEYLKVIVHADLEILARAVAVGEPPTEAMRCFKLWGKLLNHQN